jgi:hypothetical protein
LCDPGIFMVALRREKKKRKWGEDREGKGREM